ncbi:hypothetical protein DYL59_17770 [Pseudomonas kairouanensis]|uniref:Uncharacterized protein n=1 Tax=Pseudomonas kairouanensis TaxID=2293832 RepID=A0A4Z0AMK5_9PSED|nr:hypothetical protein [Pseudomonas kairouanensis]TFY87637.1 hypothetical protein DYL59_17770 [Pseudomonas kairouanensis]
MPSPIALEVAQRWLRDPREIREIRARFVETSASADIWSADTLGLVNDAVASLFDSMPHDQDEHGQPTSRMLHAAPYVPYTSLSIQPREQGLQRFEQLLALIRAEPVCRTVSTGALAAIALTASASLWLAARSATEGNRHIAQGLRALAHIAPKKGLEVERLPDAYRTLLPGVKAQDVPAMILRDFCASTFAWQYIRSPDARVHDLCGSLMVLTTAIDYVGAKDDPGAVGRAYQVAGSDGLVHLGGRAIHQAVQDMVVACAFMITKDEMVAASQYHGDLLAFIDAAGGPVTPAEFFVGRWWDAGMCPYHRMVMNSDGYHSLMNEADAFDSFAHCHAVRRAIDNLIRYNEVIDLVPDYTNGEVFNEARVALSLGGVEAVREYGTCLACVTDEVLRCECGARGHEVAAEMSMGGALWYLLLPRFQVWRQLHAFRDGPGHVGTAFAPLPAGQRLQGVMLKLLPGECLHDRSWKPLWQVGSAAQGPTLISELARRVMLRCLLPQNRQHPHALEHLIAPLLERCDRLETLLELRELAEYWVGLFDACLEVSSVSPTAYPQILNALRAALLRAWQDTVACDVQAGADTERLYVDCDSAVRRTYALPLAMGLVVRRAFFGVATSAVELGGFNPYARLTRGIATVCDSHPAHVGSV